MVGAILYTYGIHPALSDFDKVLLGFVFPALFILSGYLVLRESPNIEKRILRAIKRTAVCFAILFAAYLGLSMLFEWNVTVAAISSKIFWRDLIILNDFNLPIGFPLWYVQALLYAYIIIYLIYKLKLLKYDIYIAALCLVVTVISGELADVVGFRFLGYTYISGNFLTRALPYILIGCFIHRKKEFLANLRMSHYFFIIIVGFVLSIVEYLALGLTNKIVYVNHLLGMGVVAVGVSFFAVLLIGMEIRSDLFACLTRFEMTIPFFVSSPVYYLCRRCFLSSSELNNYLGNYTEIIVLLVSFLLLYGYSFIKRRLSGYA